MISRHPPILFISPTCHSPRNENINKISSLNYPKIDSFQFDWLKKKFRNVRGGKKLWICLHYTSFRVNSLVSIAISSCTATTVVAAASMLGRKTLIIKTMLRSMPVHHNTFRMWKKLCTPINNLHYWFYVHMWIMWLLIHQTDPLLSKFPVTI